MTLIEKIQLPGTAARAWDLLATRKGALRLAPGLTVGPDGRGTLRIVISGRSVTYRGYARQHIEEEGRHLTWTLSGKEVRGTGRAHAEVRARFRDDPEGGSDLRLTVLVEGRGRLAEISEADLERAVGSVIARFRRAVAKELVDTAAAAAPAAKGPPTAPDEAPGPPIPQLEVMPLSRPAKRRTLPVGAALGALALGLAGLLLWRSRRRG